MPRSLEDGVQPPAVGENALQQSQPPVGRFFVAVYTLALFGVFMAINLPAMVTIALRVDTIDPGHKAATYSLVAGTGTLVALLANPLFGRLSDRTRSRFGRRRPWIVVGLAGTAVGAVIIGTSHTVALLILGWCLMQCFVNAAIAALLAVVGDRVPEHQQGTVGALSGTATSAATVVGIFLIKAFPDQILAQIGLPVALSLVCGAFFVLIFGEDRPHAGPRVPFGLKEFVGSFFIDPRRSPDFARFLAGFFLIALGLGVAATYTVYYLQDQLGLADDRLTDAVFWTTFLSGVLALALAPLSGWASDRLGRRKPVVAVAAVIAAAGIIVVVTSSGLTQFLVGICLINGVATGMVYGSYIALAVSTMTDPATVARDLGIVNIAFTLPYSLVPFLAPLILGLGGGGQYVLLFLLGGGISLCGIPLILSIRNTR